MNRSCSHLVWWWWWSDFIIVCGHWTTLIIECQPVHILWNASHARVLLWEFQQATRTSHSQLSRWCKSCWTVMRGEVLHHTSRHWLVVNLIQWLFVLLQPGLLNQCRNILGMWFHHIPFLRSVRQSHRQGRISTRISVWVSLGQGFATVHVQLFLHLICLNIMCKIMMTCRNLVE